jgi:hypothetical protein
LRGNRSRTLERNPAEMSIANVEAQSTRMIDVLGTVLKMDASSLVCLVADVRHRSLPARPQTSSYSGRPELRITLFRWSFSAFPLFSGCCGGSWVFLHAKIGMLVDYQSCETHVERAVRCACGPTYWRCCV